MLTAKIVFNPKQLADALHIPLFAGSVPAGHAESIDEADYIDLNERLIVNPDATYGLTVTGDSMEDDEIHSGDLIVVDRAIQPHSSSIVVVDVDGALTVKKFSRVGGRLFLIPGNKRMRPKEIHKEQRCEAWGVVTYCIHDVR
jgi:DNA polymerase V